MELDKIEKLIAKYFDASTTIAEEEILKVYFSEGDVASHLEQYAPMFQYFSIAKEERFTPQVFLENVVTTKKKRFNYKWLSIAAVALVLFGVYYGNKVKEEREIDYAYQETKKALDLLAVNFNRGTEKVAHLNKFEETRQKLYKKQ